MTMNREAENVGQRRALNAAVALGDFIGTMTRAVGISGEKVLEIAENAEPTSKLRQEYVDAQAEREYLHKIGILGLTTNPRKCIEDKWHQEMEKITRKGVSAAEAWDTIAKTQPELHEAYLHIKETE